ncbi:MAG: S26 family signal peptidase [Myxococcota bacterium]
MQPGSYFLLGQHALSVDSRYLGVVPRSALLGVVRPLRQTAPAAKSQQQQPGQ